MRVVLFLAAFGAGVLAGYLWRGEPAAERARFERDAPNRETPTRTTSEALPTAAAGTIEGSVMFDGAPLPGVLVVAADREKWRRPDGEARPRPRATPRAEARSGADGRYVLSGLEDCVHHIWPYLKGYRFFSTGGGVDVRPGANVDFVADRVVRVGVDVRLPDGTQPELASISGRGGARERHDFSYTWWPDEAWIHVVPGHYVVSVRHDSHDAKPRRLEAREGARWVFALRSQPMIRGIVRPPPGYDYFKDVAIRAVRFEGEPPPAEGLVRAPLRASPGGLNTTGNYHLRPPAAGTYLVGLVLDSNVVQTAVVSVAQEPVTQDFEIPRPDPTDFVVVRVVDPEGKNVPELRFSVGREGVGGGTAWWIRRDDLAYLVRPYATDRTGRDYVGIRARGYGTLPLAYFERGVDRELTVHVTAPAFFRFVIPDYARSGRQARYQVRLDPVAGAWSHDSSSNRRLDTEGVVELGPLQPGPYWLVVDEDRSQPVLARRVELASGENALELRLPAVHRLTVHVSEQTFSVRLQPLDGPKALARYATPKESRVVFESVLPGRYELEYGTGADFKKVQVTIPAQSEIDLR